jgi:hypothetical protein
MKKNIKSLAYFTKIILMFLFCVSFASPVDADDGPPPTLTSFYFQKNGQPIVQPVEFTITCYGTSAMVSGGDKIMKISSFSETCQSYGCQFGTTGIFQTYKKNTEYCDIEGEVDGNKFAIKKFLTESENEPYITGLECHHADYELSIGSSEYDGYFKKTEEYYECKNDVYREYYPYGNGDVEGEFLCAKYERGEYLTPTSIPTTPNGDCYHYGYTIENNICYKISDEFSKCTKEMDKKMDLCNQYLEDVTSKLVKNENGYPYDQICDAVINISDNITNDQPSEVQTIQPIKSIDQPSKVQTIQPIKSIEKSQSQNPFINIMDFFKCLFLKLFGKSC